MSEASIALQRSEQAPFRIGLVINPLAGLGGPAGLKGSDHPDTARLAAERGVESRVKPRVHEVFKALENFQNAIHIIMPDGPMGLDLAPAWSVQKIPAAMSETTARDTQQVASELVRQGVDLLLFAGGDGTARDVCAAVGSAQAVLGIPAGVKMHSGVFAVTPRAAASVVNSLISGRLVAARQAEVRDIDEDAFSQGRVQTRYFGEMLVPDDQMLVQKVKCSGLPDDEIMLGELTAYLDELIQDEEDALWILGSGGTLRSIKAGLGMDDPTLLGVDLWYQGECLFKDAYEAQILEALKQYPDARIVISVIGGQGVILGRGNQQLSPEVIERVGLERLLLVSTPEKIRALEGRPLQVDSGSEALNQKLSGYRKILTGYEDALLYPISHQPSKDNADL